MAIVLKSFSAAGVAITDEKVICDEAVTINSTVYYKGFLNYIPNSNIGNSASAINGIWTAVSKGGTHQTTILTGYPATGSEISVDRNQGIIYSTTSRTVYCSYVGHEPVRHSISNFSVDVPYILTDGETIQIAEITFPNFSKFSSCSVNIEGQNPSTNSTITISNGVESHNITLSSSVDTSTTEFSDFLKCTTSQSLVISTTDGNDCVGFKLNLFDI